MLLRKGVNLYDCMNVWEKFNEATLLEKEELYSNLNMEDITDADNMNRKRVCKYFQVKNLGECHDLYLKSDALLLAGVFENFRKMCLKIYELHPAKFLLAPGLAWQAALKRTEVCNTIHQYAKASNKYMKGHDKNKESSYPKYWEVNNLYE